VDPHPSLALLICTVCLIFPETPALPVAMPYPSSNLALLATPPLWLLLCPLSNCLQLCLPSPHLHLSPLTLRFCLGPQCLRCQFGSSSLHLTLGIQHTLLHFGLQFPRLRPGQNWGGNRRGPSALQNHQQKWIHWCRKESSPSTCLWFLRPQATPWFLSPLVPAWTFLPGYLGPPGHPIMDYTSPSLRGVGGGRRGLCHV